MLNICIWFFVDFYDRCSHDGSIMTGYADEHNNDYFKDFAITAPHFKNVQKGKINK